jgi:hypothetical protein
VAVAGASFRALDVAPLSGCGISVTLPAVADRVLPIEAGEPGSGAGCKLGGAGEEDGVRSADEASTAWAGTPHSSRTAGSKAVAGLELWSSPEVVGDGFVACRCTVGDVG